jgi:hypothetical protein
VTEAWEAAEEIARDLLMCATSLIKDEEIAGLVFGAGLIVSDHAFNLAKMPWRLLGGR